MGENGGEEEEEEEGAQLARDIQRRLAELAEPATRVWYEERVKLGRWRGNKSDVTRRAVFEAVRQWMGGNEEGESGAAGEGGGGIRWGGGVTRYYAALHLMRSVYSDDKLAGMILFQVRTVRFFLDVFFFFPNPRCPGCDEVFLIFFLFFARGVGRGPLFSSNRSARGEEEGEEEEEEAVDT